MGSSEQNVLNDLTSRVVNRFAPQSRVDIRFQATLAYIVTWSEVRANGQADTLVRQCFIITNLVLTHLSTNIHLR